MTCGRRGTAGFLNDLMQGFAAVKAGDFLLQTSADRIAPVVEGQPVEAYPTVWSPSEGSASAASLVTVQAGEDRTGVTLRPTLTRTYRASGYGRTGPAGPMSHLALRLCTCRLGSRGGRDSVEPCVVAHDSDDVDGCKRRVHIPHRATGPGTRFVH